MSIYYKYDWDEQNKELTVYINPTEAFYEFSVEYASNHEKLSKRKSLLDSARKLASEVLPKGTVVNSYRVKFQQFLIAVLDENNGATRELLEGPACGRYKVKQNETLKDISQMFSVDENSLRKVNQLDGDTIFVGMNIKVPCYLHTVLTSDSLLKIAKRYDISRDPIRRLNNLDTDCLKIGQELKIPKRTQ
ncbi:LysM peptidoglycan-binding domain-containing protein [Sutcliffiella horikoshii]|uniref:LysM peptidoglycan-binding domain-containing protein n=1 Tax=Sutcliffiella horikoshii TaxID=79883 RepID=A0AA94WU51_9BACI|nr:LysM peptidoglycan-binding domain-containing protein [Sutcliffiella horikoshii]TYS61408.1 LysM peptidoglycan-binding domain-containing protein [Sutcliffiella horikoshii]